jgi:hypothetical protein
MAKYYRTYRMLFTEITKGQKSGECRLVDGQRILKVPKLPFCRIKGMRIKEIFVTLPEDMTIAQALVALRSYRKRG